MSRAVFEFKIGISSYNNDLIKIFFWKQSKIYNNKVGGSRFKLYSKNAAPVTLLHLCLCYQIILFVLNQSVLLISSYVFNLVLLFMGYFLILNLVLLKSVFIILEEDCTYFCVAYIDKSPLQNIIKSLCK